MYRLVLIVCIGCTLPIDEEQITGRVEGHLDNLECQLKSRMSNATNIGFREMCNNLDDDCDGKTDEDLYNIPCETKCGFGIQHCRDGEWTTCDGPAPKPETCNGLDDDCNGLVDDISPRPASISICASAKEYCVESMWECEPVEPMLSCYLTDTHTVAGTFDTPWSFSLHHEERPQEQFDRLITLAHRNNPSNLQYTQIHMYDYDEHDISWVFNDEILFALDNVHIKADSFGATSVFGVEYITQQSQGGSWLLFDEYQLRRVIHESGITEPPHPYLLHPIVTATERLGFFEQQSYGFPFAGFVHMRDLSGQEDSYQLNDSYALPYSIDAHVYRGDVWLAWLLPDGYIEIVQWDHGIVSDEIIDADAQKSHLEDLSFVDAVDPSLSYTMQFGLHTKVFIVDIEHGDNREFRLDAGRWHIKSARVGSGVAFVSGEPDGLNGEFTSLDVFLDEETWSFPLGHARLLKERDIAVVDDIAGYNIYAVYDDADFLRISHIRCE